jgi:hypothetical protein
MSSEGIRGEVWGKSVSPEELKPGDVFRPGETRPYGKKGKTASGEEIEIRWIPSSIAVELVERGAKSWKVKIQEAWMSGWTDFEGPDRGAYEIPSGTIVKIPTPKSKVDKIGPRVAAVMRTSTRRKTPIGEQLSAMPLRERRAFASHRPEKMLKEVA